MAMSVFPADSYEEFLHGVLQDYHYQPVKDEFRLGQIFFNKLEITLGDTNVVLEHDLKRLTNLYLEHARVLIRLALSMTNGLLQ